MVLRELMAIWKGRFPPACYHMLSPPEQHFVITQKSK